MVVAAGQTVDREAPCPNAACSSSSLIAFRTAARVLLVLVALVPVAVGMVWFRVAAGHPERCTTAEARGALRIVIAVGLATAALGLTAGRYATILSSLLLRRSRGASPAARIAAVLPHHRHRFFHTRSQGRDAFVHAQVGGTDRVCTRVLDSAAPL